MKWNVSEYPLYLIILDTGSESKETKGQGQRLEWPCDFCMQCWDKSLLVITRRGVPAVLNPFMNVLAEEINFLAKNGSPKPLLIPEIVGGNINIVHKCITVSARTAGRGGRQGSMNFTCGTLCDADLLLFWSIFLNIAYIHILSVFFHWLLKGYSISTSLFTHDTLDLR